MLFRSRDEQVTFTPVYELISNYALGGASGTGAAYLETMGLLCKYGTISRKRYRLTVLKYWIGKLVRG